MLLQLSVVSSHINCLTVDHIIQINHHASAYTTIKIYFIYQVSMCTKIITLPAYKFAGKPYLCVLGVHLTFKLFYFQMYRRYRERYKCTTRWNSSVYNCNLSVHMSAHFISARAHLHLAFCFCCVTTTEMSTHYVPTQQQANQNVCRDFFLGFFFFVTILANAHMIV